MENTLWVESYRPSTIDECILPVEIKKTFKSILKQGEIPNLFAFPYGETNSEIMSLIKDYKFLLF